MCPAMPLQHSRHLTATVNILVFTVSHLQDCGCDANWSGSYHIDDVDPNAAQDLEVFVYDAATDGHELIGKSLTVFPYSIKAEILPYDTLYPFMALHKTHAQACRRAHTLMSIAIPVPATCDASW